MDYVLHILVLASLYGVLAISLDLVAGHAGVLSLAHAAFFGIGAYTAAILAVSFDAPLWMSLPAAGALAAISSVALSASASRLKRDHLVVAIVGFQMLIYSVLENWTGLTSGAVGIARIPAARIGGLEFVSPGAMAILATALLGIVLVATVMATRGPYGRALHAVRDDELLATVMGRRPAALRLSAFALSAAMAASAGVLYAHYFAYLEPATFDLTQSLLILAMVLIGGPASSVGALIGAVFLIVLPEPLRLVHLSLGAVGHVRQILYGGLLIVIVILRPRGIAGRIALGR